MEVKVCNLRSNDFKREFTDSLINTGFAVVTHHGIDFGLIKEAQESWRYFFNRDEDFKNEYVNPTDSNMGYTGRGGEKAVGAKKADLKEFYHWKPGFKVPMGVATPTIKLFNALEDVGGQLLHALNGLGSDLNYQKVCESSDNTLLRALYYPALGDFHETNGAVRAAAHEDINFITLLVAASAPGLQVQDKNGEWHSVPFEENSIVVNVGDSLQLASGGLFKSTTHRVVNPKNNSTDRISLPLFVHPKGNTFLASGITAQQFLAERLNIIYKKGYEKL